MCVCSVFAYFRVCLSDFVCLCVCVCVFLCVCVYVCVFFVRVFL